MRGNLASRPWIILTAFGNALGDLWISILHPGLGSFDTDIGDSGAVLASKGPIHFGDTGIMGQAILYWARYQPAGVTAGDGPRSPSEVRQ